MKNRMIQEKIKKRQKVIIRSLSIRNVLSVGAANADIMRRDRPFPVILQGRKSLVLPVISVSNRKKPRSAKSVLMITVVNYGQKKRELFLDDRMSNNDFDYIKILTT
ncbi:MAG: hypothetical protein HDR13_06885 [Lachnospiraceae bacterium]|nr:hypothetical protein [Lachnospiraceae bacterium]